jgi:hypothetical protein
MRRRDKHQLGLPPQAEPCKPDRRLKVIWKRSRLSISKPNNHSMLSRMKPRASMFR